MNDEEVAFRIVRLYFEEIARLGFKRQLDLDQMINAYFYTLKKLENKDALLRNAIRELSVSDKKGEQKTVEKTVQVRETTIKQEKSSERSLNESHSDEQSISDILEEK